MLQFIHANFKLDLTHLQVTFSEENQWFKDDFSMEFSFPFSLYLKGEFAKNSEFKNHYNASSNKTIYNGYLDKDGKTSASVLKMQEVIGDFASVTITAGEGSFPSFDKKLSQLMLETKEVENIVEDAVAVIPLGYPATNYNYPMVHTDKYDPTDADWNGFEKIINNYREGEFVSNALQLDSNIDLIKNIMQPLPYLMHIVKTGIEAAGCTLAGDILLDENLKKALIFRDGDYYQRLSEEELPFIIKNNEWTSVEYVLNDRDHVNYYKEIVIEKKGDYIFFGDVISLFYKDIYGTPRSNVAWTVRKISGGVETILYNYNIYGFVSTNESFPTMNVGPLDIEVSFEAGDLLTLEKNEVRRNFVPSLTPDYPEAVSLKLIPIRYRNLDGSPIISVLNLNEIDLTRVVPDMTFRDLITILKNWFNYDLTESEGVISMNLIQPQLNRDSAKNISDFDIEEPIRTPHDDREFELSFSDGKAGTVYKYDSVLVTNEGAVINDYTLKESASLIKIDALPLPVILRNGVTTAHNFEDESSKLRIVFMKPMPEGALPVAFHNPNVEVPNIYETNFKAWLDFRTSSQGWQWDFLISVERMRDVNIQTLVYAYNNYHAFTEIEKERLNSVWWRVTAKTESLL